MHIRFELFKLYMYLIENQSLLVKIGESRNAYLLWCYDIKTKCVKSEKTSCTCNLSHPHKNHAFIHFLFSQKNYMSSFLIKWPCLYTFQLHHFLMDFRDLWNTLVLSFQRNDIKIWVQTLLQLIHVSFNFWSRSYTFKTCWGVLLFFT